MFGIRMRLLATGFKHRALNHDGLTATGEIRCCQHRQLELQQPQPCGNFVRLRDDFTERDLLKSMHEHRATNALACCRCQPSAFGLPRAGACAAVLRLRGLPLCDLLLNPLACHAYLEMLRATLPAGSGFYHSRTPLSRAALARARTGYIIVVHIIHVMDIYMNNMH